MLKQKKSKVINISPTNAEKSWANVIPYNASKTAICMFIRSLALEWAPFTININAIGPGLFYTKLSTGYGNPKLLEKMVAIIPLGRWEIYAALGCWLYTSLHAPRIG